MFLPSAASNVSWYYRPLVVLSFGHCVFEILSQPLSCFSSKHLFGRLLVHFALVGLLDVFFSNSPIASCSMCKISVVSRFSDFGRRVPGASCWL